jgi:hypothetical protein
MSLISHARALGLNEAADLAEPSTLDKFRGIADDATLALIQEHNTKKCRDAVVDALYALVDDQPSRHVEAGVVAAVATARARGFGNARAWKVPGKGSIRRVYLNDSFTVDRRTAVAANVAAGQHATGAYAALSGRPSNMIDYADESAIVGAFQARINELVNADRDAVLPAWWREYLPAFGSAWGA